MFHVTFCYNIKSSRKVTRTHKLIKYSIAEGVFLIKNQVSQLITPRKVAQLEEKTIYQIISNYWMRLSMTSYKIVLLYRFNLNLQIKNKTLLSEFARA